MYEKYIEWGGTWCNTTIVEIVDAAMQHCFPGCPSVVLIGGYRVRYEDYKGPYVTTEEVPHRDIHITVVSKGYEEVRITIRTILEDMIPHPVELNVNCGGKNHYFKVIDRT